MQQLRLKLFTTGYKQGTKNILHCMLSFQHFISSIFCFIFIFIFSFFILLSSYFYLIVFVSISFILLFSIFRFDGNLDQDRDGNNKATVKLDVRKLSAVLGHTNLAVTSSSFCKCSEMHCSEIKCSDIKCRGMK